MVISSSISSYPKPLVCFSGCIQREIGSRICTVDKFSSFCSYQWRSKMASHVLGTHCTRSRSLCRSAYVISTPRIEQRLNFKGMSNSIPVLSKHMKVSLSCRNINTGIRVPDRRVLRGMGLLSFLRKCTLSGIVVGMLFCCSLYKPIFVQVSLAKQVRADISNSALDGYSHGKKVLMDYSVIGIPGDGRCLFRSVVYGVSVRSGKPPPNESRQRELADELRDRVADEFIKRRKETEWFIDGIDGDFNTYVSRIRKPHVWGGEPELLMASYVLEMPISVYTWEGGRSGGGVISIAEYGKQYGEENPICVLYHGSGHYEALIFPTDVGPTSRL